MEKKKRKKPKFDKKSHFLPVLTFFWKSTVSRVSEWLANFSWEKKIQNREEKKQKLPKSSEWVPPNLFRGKKKYGTFDGGPFKIITYDPEYTKDMISMVVIRQLYVPQADFNTKNSCWQFGHKLDWPVKQYVIWRNKQFKVK